jgi:NADH-quinone oxidoreductase subunit H
MITTSAVCVALFFGGWHIPWLDKIWPALSGNLDPNHPSLTTSLIVCLIRSAAFFLKIWGVIFVFMWVRWTLPRFRFDQLMMVAWRALIPMSLALLLVTGLVLYFVGPGDARYVNHDVVGGKLAFILFIANGVVLAFTLLISALLPPPPETNRRLHIVGSRFHNTPLPAGSAG